VGSGEPLPAEQQRQLIATRSFQAGLQTLRQVEFALFDMRLHAEYDPARGGRVYDILGEVRSEVAVVPIPAWNRYPHSFSHIFAGGYAAGYYSYKWAEVLAADAFSAFVEHGAFDARTGKRLWHFQEIPHDIWDRDIPAPPNLATITRDGRRVDVVAVTTKNGDTLVLDRVTGKPIFPFRMRRAPTSANSNASRIGPTSARARTPKSAASAQAIRSAASSSANCGNCIRSGRPDSGRT